MSFENDDDYFDSESDEEPLHDDLFDDDDDDEFEDEVMDEEDSENDSEDDSENEEPGPSNASEKRVPEKKTSGAFARLRASMRKKKPTAEEQNRENLLKEAACGKSLPADLDFAEYLKKDKLKRMPIASTWKESGNEPCYLCFKNSDSNLSRHMEKYHFDKAELKKDGIHKDMLGWVKENYKKRCSNDETHFKFARIQQKAVWNDYLKDCAAEEKYKIIETLERIGLIFCPITKPWTNFRSTPAWAPELEKTYLAGKNDVPQLPSDSIGDISQDPRGAYVESSMGGTKGQLIAEVKASGLMRMLKKEDHPLLKEYHDYVCDIYKRREQRKAKTAEQQATSKTNFLAKALLVSLRLTGEVGQKTIHRITDVKKEDFIRGIIAYYRCYRKIYKTGGGALNFLKNMKFFVSHVRLFDTRYSKTVFAYMTFSIFADMNWALSIEMYLSTIDTMISTANPDATAASAESRAARDVPKYYDLMQIVKPMYAHLKKLADRAKEREDDELIAAFTSKEFNTFGLFLGLAIVLENGQRAELTYKVQLGFMKSIEKEKEIVAGDETPYTIPFHYSKTNNNVFLGISEELYHAVIQYMRLRLQWVPIESDEEPLFVTSTGNRTMTLFEDVRIALKQTLDIDFTYSNPAVRNSAANTYARDFMDTEDLKLTAFPAQGAMNHSLETHRKIYITDARYLTHVGWRWLRKSAATPEILPENYKKEQKKIMEILEKKGASFSDEKPWDFEPTQWQKSESLRKNAIGKTVELLCHREGENLVYNIWPDLMGAILMAVDPAEEEWISRDNLRTFISCASSLVERLCHRKSDENKALLTAKIVLDTLGYPYMICSAPKISDDEPTQWKRVYFCGISDSAKDAKLDTQAPIIMAAYSCENNEFYGIARLGAADMTKQQALHCKNGEKTEARLITREDGEKLHKRTVEYLKGGMLRSEVLEDAEEMNFKAWKARRPGFQEEKEIKTEKTNIQKIDRPSTSRTPQKKNLDIADVFSPVKRKITPPPPVTPQKRKKEERQEEAPMVKSPSASSSLLKMFKKKNSSNLFEFKQKIYDTRFHMISAMLENPTWPLVLSSDPEYRKDIENIKEKASTPHSDHNLAYMQYAFGIWPLIAKMEPKERMKSAHSIGQGVKATMFIPEGTIVGAYYGRHTDKEGFKRIVNGPNGEEERKYLITSKNQYSLGRSSCHREGKIDFTSMALANHSNSHPNVAICPKTYPTVNNKDVKIDDGKMPIFFRAEKDIYKGEELLWNYGQDGIGMDACPCDRCYGQCQCTECEGTKFHEDKKAKETKKKIIDCYKDAEGEFDIVEKSSDETSRMLYRDLEGKHLYNDNKEENMEKKMNKAVKKIEEALKSWDKKGDRESIGKAIEGAPGVLPAEITEEIWDRVKTVEDIEKIYGKVMLSTIFFEKTSEESYKIHRYHIGKHKPRCFLVQYTSNGEPRLRQLNRI